ncbi:slipin family protein [Mycoplasmatota bacterium]|nr:slipin family protein [Mycoplasmatota bacterium]
MKYIIKSNEVGLLFKKQVFKKVLTVGEYTYVLKSRKVIIVNKKIALENNGIEVKTLANNKVLLNKITSIQVKENEVAFHFIDGLFFELLTAGTYSFFNDTYAHTFTIVDTKDIYIPDSIDISVLESLIYHDNYRKIICSYVVEEGFIGILKVNGKFGKLLGPGKYYFFTNINVINVKYIDTRNQVLQISGQELLTKDKVTLRMNFVLSYKITDSLKAATTLDHYEEQLYLFMQLALREYVSTKTLDELLAEKHEIGKIILDTVKPKENDFGAIFMEAGLKDIILPGEIKDILNTILLAEKKAQANVITRREETASTRSLLNTAKIMDENETLYKLKELEYLERICDKVGNISFSSSGGIIEQLNELIKVSKK